MDQTSLLKRILLWSTVFITPCVGAQDYKDEVEPGYKSLVQILTTTINKGGFSTFRVEEKFEITTQSGAVKKANYDIVSDDPRANFILVKAVVTNGSRTAEIEPEAVHHTKQSIPGQSGGLSEIAVYRIPFKQVRIGSVVHVIYEFKKPPILPGIFDMGNGIDNTGFAVEERQVVLSDSPMKIKSEGFGEHFSIEESKSDEKYKLVIAPTERGRNLVGKGLKVGKYFVSTAKSWKQINQKIAPHYRAALEEPLPKEFEDIFKMANAASKTERKIEIVGDELQKVITYSGDWRTMEGKYFPSGHANVVKSGRGDCKDFSTSMVAILRKLGFKAEVAFSYRSRPGMNRELYKEMSQVPGLLLFNHAIVWAQDQTGKEWWIDPTNPKVLPDVIGADLLGNFALVLNNEDSEVRFIPERNKVPWKLNMAHTMELAPDGAVEVISKQEYNETSYNNMIILERHLGAQNMIKVLIGMVNPMRDVTGQSAFKAENGKYIYDVRFRTPHLIVDKKGHSLAFVVRPVVANITAFYRTSDQGLDLGEEGVFITETRIKGHKILDPIASECLVRSPWVHFEREIQVIGADTKVLDRLDIKKRFISSEEIKKGPFDGLLSDIGRCEADENLIVSFQSSKKTSEMIEWESLRGPEVSSMTEADVIKLRELDGPEYGSYVNKKLYRYFSNRIKKNEFDSAAYAERAGAVRRMGYQSGNKFSESYLEAAMQDVFLGEKSLGGGFDVKLSRIKAQILGNRGDMKAAITELSVLQKKAAESYETAITGFYLADLTNNYPIAEQWLKVALPRARFQFEKEYVRERLASVLGDQKKYDEALKHYEILLKDKENDPWLFHNAALFMKETGRLDRCIELERKALGISDFGAARNTLAKALVAKADAVRKGLAQGQDPSAVPYDKDQLALYMEALKWNPRNLQAHVHLAESHIQDFKAKKDREGLKKARDLVTQALSIRPQYPYGNKMLKMLDELEGGRETAQAE